MKNALLTTVLLCAAAVSATAQEMPWFMDHLDYPYKGHVKEVHVYDIAIYEYSDNDAAMQDTDYYRYTYSADGRILTRYTNVDLECYDTFHWSDRLDSIVGDGDEGCIKSKYFYYDSDGQIITVMLYGTDFSDTTTIEYDKRGFPVAANNGEWYEWTDDGHIKGIGSKHFSKQYEYNSQGQMVKESYDDKYVTLYSYNDNGDVSRTVESCVNPSYCDGTWTRTTNYTYKYDSHGNWTEKRAKNDDGDNYVTIRHITYYE